MDDFSELRAYRSGDRLSRVHWAASSRSSALQVKQFVDPVVDREWLSWEDYPQLDTEARLRHLAHLIWLRDEGNQSFGLILPGQTIEPDSGERHRDRCLASLGVWGQRESGIDVD